jgi:YihY family inner membrane protein
MASDPSPNGAPETAVRRNVSRMPEPIDPAAASSPAQLGASGRATTRRRRAVALRRPHPILAVKRFWHLAWEAGLTGLASMVAYNMLLAVIPVALLGLFVAGQVLSSTAVQHSVLTDLSELFPGTTRTTLNDLLGEVKDSTTSTGVLALIASVWLGSSFWGALDTSFTRIYRCPGRSWLTQKRFGIVMVVVVLVFMIATVAVPTVQSILVTGAGDLPFDLARITNVVYGISLGVSLALLFGCLALIYARVPNRSIPWRAIWPGALGATIAITIVDYAFPAYLSHISTIARFGTTVVFVLIVLGWFYVIAIIILGGGVVNALRLETMAERS